MKVHPRIASAVLGLTLCMTQAHAAPVPTAISTQGVLRANAGGLQDGMFNMTFSIYAVQTGGTALYTETQAAVPVESGIFTALVGVNIPLDPTLFVDHTVLWLGVLVQGDTLELPRFALTTTPYAFQAQHAENASVAAAVGPNAVGTAGLQAGSVNSSTIADHTITAADLSNMGCTGGQLLSFDGTAWVCITPSAGTAYTGGGGVDVSGTLISLAAGGVGNTQLAADAVTSNKIFDGTIQKADLSDMTCTAGQHLVRSAGTGWVCASLTAGTGLDVQGQTVSILARGVGNAQLNDNAVTTDKITNGTILAEDLSAMGCTLGQILVFNGTTWTCGVDQNTTYSHGAGLTLTGTTFSIPPGGVTATELGTGAVTTTKLAAGSVDTTALGAGAVDANALANGAVTSAKLFTGAVDTAALGAGAVTSAKIFAGAVDTTALGNLSVTTAKLAAGSVDSTALGASSVTTGKIAPAAVDTTNFASSVYAGTAGDFGTAATVARSDHHHAATCPAGLTAYPGVANGPVLCLAVVTAALSYKDAASACFRNLGGHLCSTAEEMIACSASPALTPANGTWLADIVASGNNSAALRTNDPTNCNKTAQATVDLTTATGYMCCLQVNRY